MKTFGAEFMDIQGDGLFALFHGQRKRERALCAAVTASPLSMKLEKRLEGVRRDEPDTGLKFGLAIGDVFVKKVAVRGENEPIWDGVPVNWATKLAQAVDKGSPFPFGQGQHPNLTAVRHSGGTSHLDLLHSSAHVDDEHPLHRPTFLCSWHTCIEAKHPGRAVGHRSTSAAKPGSFDPKHRPYVLVDVPTRHGTPHTLARAVTFPRRTASAWNRVIIRSDRTGKDRSAPTA